VSGGVLFPVLEDGGDGGLTAMEVAYKGLLTVPTLAAYPWSRGFTVGCARVWACGPSLMCAAAASLWVPLCTMLLAAVVLQSCSC
jgi:hypothetical protein